MKLKALAYAISDRLLGILPAVCGHWSSNGLRFTARYGMGLKPLGALVKGRYEAAELSLLQRVLQKEDRVLEIGSGMGFLALNAAKIVGAESVLGIEANPMMVEIAQRNAQLNSLPVTFHHGVISDSEGFARFRLHRQFWRSRLADESAMASDIIDVPKLPFSYVLQMFNPTIVVIDIEGGEIEVAKYWHLSNVRGVIAELHPWIVGEEPTFRFCKSLEEQGFTLSGRSGNVVLFLRDYEE